MLKNTSIILLLSIMMFGCNCEKKKNNKVNNPYLGTWTRSFEMGPEVKAKVTYTFQDDAIQYEMDGPMKLKYTIVKDTFLVKEKRWIGTKKNETYVIFIKNDTKENLTLLKMKVKNQEEALKMPFPSDSARSKFSSWNTFNRK